MKASDHLFQFHKAANTHHTAMVKAHEAALKKAQGMKDGDGDDSSEFHKAAIQNHSAMADYHENGMSECSKAISDSLNKMNQLEPTNVRGVIPSHDVRPVLRAGQREISDAEVDPEFEKMFSED
jgi:hypothetical protein